MPHLCVDLEEVGGLHERRHMCVEMREMNARRLCAIDLRAQFIFDVRHLCILRDRCGFQRQISLRVIERWHLVTPTHRSPSKVGPFTIQSLVDAQIPIRMLAGDSCHFLKPWARHKDAGRCDPSILQRLSRRAVHGVGHAIVIRMNDQQPRGGPISELLLNSLWRGLRNSEAGAKKHAEKHQRVDEMSNVHHRSPDGLPRVPIENRFNSP